jgi:hypothetical protein
MDTPMDPREQFSTEAFFRYSSECWRLARLARKPSGGATPGSATAYRLWIDRLGDIQAQYFNPLLHRPQLVTSRLRHR